MDYSFQDTLSIEQQAVGFRPSNDTECGRNRERSNQSNRQYIRSGNRGSGRGYRNNRVPSGQRNSESRENPNPHPWNVFNILLKDYEGKTSLRNIRRLFPKAMSDIKIKSWFENDKHKRFTVFTDVSDRISFIAVGCRGKLCLQYGQSGCTRENCVYFHLCRNFLAGYCKSGVQCKYSHHFQEEHNKEMLKKYYLSKYDEQELKTILIMSVPQVCSSYNKNLCPLGLDCTDLHICEEFVMNGSCSSDDCPFDNSFRSGHTLKLLERFQLDRFMNKEDLLRKYILVKKSDTRKQHPRDGTSNYTGNAERPKSTPNRDRRRGGGRGGRSSSKPRHNSGSHREQSLDTSYDNDESDQHNRVSTNVPMCKEEYSHTKETWAGPVTCHSSTHKIKGEREVSISKQIHPLGRLMKDVQLQEQRKTGMDQESTLDDIKKKMQTQRANHPDIERRLPLRGDTHIKNTASYHKYQHGTKDYDTHVENFRSRRSSSDLDQNLKYESKPLDYGATSETYAQKEFSKSSAVTSDMNKDCICLENLIQQCSLGQHCPYFHSDKPYAWHIKVFDHWYQIDERQERILEEYYCNPAKDSEVIKLRLDALDEPLKLSINFDSLNAIAHDGNYSALPVKRRCIPSAEWLWYQKKDDNYVQLSSVVNAAVEKHYASYKKHPGTESCQLRSSSGTDYFINVKNMKITILGPGDDYVCSQIKRRPKTKL